MPPTRAPERIDHPIAVRDLVLWKMRADGSFSNVDIPTSPRLRAAASPLSLTEQVPGTIVIGDDGAWYKVNASGVPEATAGSLAAANTWALLQTFTLGIAADTIAEKTVGAGVTIDGLLVKDGSVGSVAAPATAVTATTLVSDTISERTAAAGVTIDGVLLKDAGIVDSVFVYDAAAPTKKARLDAGNVTAGQTRVISSADRDVDLDHALMRTFVTVTAAQIRALRATPISLVTQPGPVKYLEFVSAHLWLDFGTVAHDAPVDPGDDLGIKYTNGSGQTVGTQEATGFINAGADAHRNLSAGAAPVATATDVIPVANAALVLHNIGPTEFTGTGDSVLKVEVLFRVRNIEPVP